MRWLAILALLLLPSFASSQTVVSVGPFTTANKADWDPIANVTAAQAAALVYFPAVDDQVTTQPLANVTCPVVGTTYRCNANLTPELVTKLNAVGAHELKLKAVSLTGGESPLSLPFASRTPPAAPSGVRILP